MEKVESMMFEKEKGNTKINRLRIIDKYEADYNLLLKSYWPKITNNIAEKNNTLGKNQLGTRKRKSSTDVAMINEFILDTARIHQQTIDIQQNDASACYDRIIANHASINSRREGTPKRVCKLRANTLHSTNFHIQTSLGTSKESYSHKQYPIHESGQGGGSAGNEFTFISVPIIKTIEKISPGWYSTNLNNKNKWETYMLVFVDDSRNFVTTKQRTHSNSPELCNLLQHAAQSWEHILSTSEGKLNPAKCVFYILQWTFQPDGTSKVDNTSVFRIPITSSDTKESINVPYLHPNQPATYLGHISQPDGNQTAPYNLVLSKTKNFAQRIISTNMSRQLITMTNSSIIDPTIKYPLTSPCFTDQQIDTIHKSIHPTVIAGMGYTSKWPKELRYGTHKHFSLKLQYSMDLNSSFRK